MTRLSPDHVFGKAGLWSGYINGSHHLPTPPSVLRLIAGHLPHRQVVVVPESGHNVQWEQPEFFNRAVLRFLRSRGRR